MKVSQLHCYCQLNSHLLMVPKSASSSLALLGGEITETEEGDASGFHSEYQMSYSKPTLTQWIYRRSTLLKKT